MVRVLSVTTANNDPTTVLRAVGLTVEQVRTPAPAVQHSGRPHRPLWMGGRCRRRPRGGGAPTVRHPGKGKACPGLRVTTIRVPNAFPPQYAYTGPENWFLFAYRSRPDRGKTKAAIFNLYTFRG